MKTTKDIQAAVKNIRFYADKIYSLLDRQLEADYMESEPAIEEVVKQIGNMSEEANHIKADYERILLGLTSIDIANDIAIRKEAEETKHATESKTEESTLQAGPDDSGDTEAGQSS